MYKLIQDTEKAYESLDFIRSTDGVIGLDIETTGLDCFTDSIILVQICLKGEVLVYEIRKLGYSFLASLVRLLEHRPCIIHNADFDIKFLYHRTKIWLRNVFCSLICEATLNAGKDSVGLSLKDLAFKYCGVEMDKESREDFVDFPEEKPITEQMLIYSVKDVLVLSGIYNAQMELVKQANEEKVIELEMKLIPVVANMEYNGIYVDKSDWASLEDRNRKLLTQFTTEFKEYCISRVLETVEDKSANALTVANMISIPVKTKKLSSLLEGITAIDSVKDWLVENFNVNSSTQMLSVLNILGADVESTNEKILMMKASDSEAVKKLLEIRGLAKQVSTYGLSWLDDVHPLTGMIHSRFFSGGTKTGRFSSSKPNMQNVPRKGGFRECFKPRSGYKFISCDYSQQEYRLAGAVSGEQVIIDSYVNGYDMHSATASLQFGVPIEDVTSEQRNLGKTLNFAILYGSSEYGLHKNLKIPMERAKEIINKFFGGYPRLSLFRRAVEEKILDLGYSVTPLGRRRYNASKPLFLDSRGYLKWSGEVKREGFNLIIQGGGADIIKIAMVNIWNNNPYGDKFKIVLQIHDELLFEVADEIKDDAFEFIKKEMLLAEQPFLGKIPAAVDGKISDNWCK